MTLDAFLAWQEIRLRRQLYDASHRPSPKPVPAAQETSARAPEDIRQSRVEAAKRARLKYRQRLAARKTEKAARRLFIAPEDFDRIRLRIAARRAKQLASRERRLQREATA